MRLSSSSRRHSFNGIRFQWGVYSWASTSGGVDWNGLTFCGTAGNLKSWSRGITWRTAAIRRNTTSGSANWTATIAAKATQTLPLLYGLLTSRFTLCHNSVGLFDNWLDLLDESSVRLNYFSDFLNDWFNHFVDHPMRFVLTGRVLCFARSS